MFKNSPTQAVRKSDRVVHDGEKVSLHMMVVVVVIVIVIVIVVLITPPQVPFRGGNVLTTQSKYNGRDGGEAHSTRGQSFTTYLLYIHTHTYLQYLQQTNIYTLTNLTTIR